MTTLLIVLLAFATFTALAVLRGADTRPNDPSDMRPHWFQLHSR